ncbi:hypothetical protein DQ04_00011440 [Trypanosoma grayi]|uniref:hypothetical protein n=1 Tax=Trypanosoma grayi TaxID=71804 RepID=UPI0004F4783B|nr:hypothetical protein DQ04_00011440 [Trypanosoma grayi]KEG15677.1 hypothetical protein DQ04_00011440 [Trypanosoma grayi]
MTDHVAESEVSFVNGQPGFAYSNVYRCFPDQGNGLLFRLVNAKKQWAFHNDTQEMLFHVTALLGKGSKVKPLGRASLVAEPEDSEWGYQVTVTVDAGRTERFLEGTVEGFLLDFASDPVPVDDVEFLNGSPTVKYDSVFKCIKDHGNGLLFRLVTEDPATGERTWSYYNDTEEFAMEVEVAFPDKSCVEPLGKTMVEDSSDHANGSVYKLSIAPLQTEPFLRGYPRDYKQSVVADPIMNEESLDPASIEFENGAPNSEIIEYPCSKVFKCFKNKGNGLMFLLINEDTKKWAFYNDTNDYEITATVKFSPESVYEPAEKTSMTGDPDVTGGTICVITVPPVTTELFIFNGNPTNYQLSFSADGVTRSKPEDNPEYENEGPDKEIMPYCDKVYKCFKDHGNGLLFRLVDERNNKWAFYNDTKDVTFTVRVSFEEDASVELLGKTQLADDADLGTVYLLEVPPLATELFVGGELSSFTSKFSGRGHHSK